MDEEPQQQCLFQLPYTTPEEARRIIRPLRPYLWPVIRDIWEDLQDRRGRDRFFTDLTEEEMGIWLTMQAGRHAQAIFAGQQGITVEKWYRKPVIIIPDLLAIIIKKLTKRKSRRDGPEELTRSNYMTDRTKRLHRQQRGSCLPDLPRVILGYEFVREATEIRIFIAYPRTRGRGFDWVYRLRKPAVTSPVLPDLKVFARGDEPAEDKGFVIGPAEKTGDEEKESDKG